MKVRVYEAKAWVVDTNSFSYLGIYAFDPSTKTRPWQDGCLVALFRTRDEARKELKRLHVEHPGYFPKATVRHVVVTITSGMRGSHVC